MFNGLDHIAILVVDTEAALRIYRDRLGFPVLFSEEVMEGAVRLTHLDMGNVHLQLVEPLNSEHPIYIYLQEHGPGLHHFCMKVNNVADATEEAKERGIAASGARPHQAPRGKRALFLNREATGDVLIELTGE